ncbi:AAA family ATPase [Nonomuraea sp. NPDC050547]|uniref:helix-turn-helix transcriptional regulator n=1 Tax=Nonomuraea sp. NPDC050547 TaxID=3364368 RepID=UPI003788362A
MLHGRTDETAMIERLLSGAREGTSAALVIRGEAGIGKTALLEAAAARAGELPVLRGAGIESEHELPYAGLSLLLGRTAERLDRLPEGQARALAAALGTGPAGEGEPFLVGLAVLTLLAEAGPLVCLVDDAQWLDHASAAALLFAARRLEAEGVVMLLTVREPHAPGFPAAGLAELRLGGLADESAQALLTERAGGLSATEREEVLVESAGNPLALLELSASRRRSGPYSMGIVPVQSRIQQGFADRVAALPEATRTLMLVAAADDTGEAAAVLAAAGLLGAGPADLEPAERAELLTASGARLAFGHPLIRSAVYRRAPLARRMAAHRALADVLDGDRSVWHLAAATQEPDEDVAAALAATAERARDRGGYAAVAAAYARAAELTPDPAVRARRHVAAARAATDAGQFEKAAELLRLTGMEERVHAAKLRAVLAESRDDAQDAYRILLHETDPSAPDDSVVLLRDAVAAAWRNNDFECVEMMGGFASTLAGGAPVATLATAALAANRVERGEVADGLAALRDLLADPPGEDADVRDRLLFARMRLITGDIAGAYGEVSWLERDAREHGALGTLPAVQVILARCQLFTGAHRDARLTAEDGLRIAADTGQTRPALELRAVLAELAAVEGEEERCRELTAEALERGLAPGSVHAAAALSLLDLGLGRYEPAFDRLAAVLAGSRPMGMLAALPIMVEAAVRLGRPADAAGPAATYERWAHESGQAWARGVSLRNRALLTDDLDDYAPAVHHEAFPLDRARAGLLYGERLRRERRMSEARTWLRTAAEAFERLGAPPWAERARRELRATGESRAVRAHAPDLAERLTAQELQAVRLAAQGLSNREIGARLFLSPRTVGYHLYNAFPKLGVASRGELAGLGL